MVVHLLAVLLYLGAVSGFHPSFTRGCLCLLINFFRLEEPPRDSPNIRRGRLLITISLGWEMSEMSFRLPVCINSVPTCSGCCQVPAIDIHVMGSPRVRGDGPLRWEDTQCSGCQWWFSNLFEGCYNLNALVSDIHVVDVHVRGDGPLRWKDT